MQEKSNMKWGKKKQVRNITGKQEKCRQRGVTPDAPVWLLCIRKSTS